VIQESKEQLEFRVKPGLVQLDYKVFKVIPDFRAHKVKPGFLELQVKQEPKARQVSQVKQEFRARPAFKV
jgi:hypothetical protein